MPQQLAFRVASGVVVAAVAVACIWYGPPWLTLLGLIGGSIALFETYRLTPERVGRMPLAMGIVAVLVLLLAAEAASGTTDYLVASGAALAVWALAATLWFIAAYEGERPVAAFLLLLLGPVYAGFLLGHGLAIYDIGTTIEPVHAGSLLGRDLDIYDIGATIEGNGILGRNWLLFILAGTSACDTGAYAVGRLMGRHQMAPVISPNKTWEGAIGGFVASVGAMLAVGVLLDLGVAMWQQAVVAVAVAIAAQTGDLVESVLKRAANVKDSGSIMPGHGGLLDRIDSTLFVLPAVYYLLALGFGL